METITPATNLLIAIQLLEVEQEAKAKLLKEQFYITYESLKPVSILKNAIKEVATSPDLVDNVVGTVTGLAAGYLSKKMFVGKSGSIVRNLFGSLVQFGITNLVSRHPDEIRSLSRFFVNQLIHTRDVKEVKTE
jgi:hypothetical protein